MSITVKTTQKNPGWVEKLKARMSKQSKREVAVGYPRGESGVGNPHYDTGASILEVAIWNNFGTSRIPPRPFMENSSAPLQEMWKKMCKDAQKRINAGEISEETVCKAAALKGESIIRNEIDAIMEPPNSPQTIKRKGSAKPLIDSGDMRKFVKGIVRNK